MARRVLLLKTTGSDARLNRLNSTAPIRSRAAEEGSFQIPLWSVPLILLLLYLCLFSGLGALGLVGPDEPRYAAIARAMSETHDWVTPRLWGTPWFEKPVLYYWTAGIAMRLFGVSEFAARLPSALAALLAVAAVAWTALRSYGLGAAWYSLLMLPTSVAMIGFSRAASPDMLFAGLLTAAMAVAVEMLQKPRPDPILRVAFGFFLGAAVLAKGPAAVILAGGATLLWAALSRQWRAPFRFLHPLIIAVFCATALPWYVLCALRNPDFLRVFIWQHNFQRYLTPIFEHRQPFWFFGPIFLLGMLPWLPLLIPSVKDARAQLSSVQRVNSPALFIACWALFVLLFFSLSQSKLPGYILPAFPPVFLLLSVSTERIVLQKSGKLSSIIVSIGSILPVGIAIALANRSHSPLVFATLDTTFTRGFEIALGVAIVGLIAIVTFSIRLQQNYALCAAALTVAILIFLANRLILPVIDTIASARPAADWTIRLHSLTTEDVVVYRLPRAYQFGLNYYFDAPLSEWTPENTRAKVLFASRDALDSLPLRRLPGTDLAPGTSDGKVFFAILRPPAEK
jgi:4-amino-4-deoxy-L-arabinose transferase-like glycosyltransferase